MMLASVAVLALISAQKRSVLRLVIRLPGVPPSNDAGLLPGRARASWP
jgi:hypothetical protein